LTAGPDSTWNFKAIDLNTGNSSHFANFRINGATVNVGFDDLNEFGLMLSRGPNALSSLLVESGTLTATRIGIGRQQNNFQNAGTGSVQWSGGTIGNLAGGRDLLINSYDITDNYGLQINLTNAGDKTLSVESGRIARVGPNAINFNSSGVVAGTNTSGAYFTGTEGRLVIAGGGTVRLYQSNSYSGQVKIDNGTLTLVGGSETFDGVSGTYSASIAPSALEIATNGTLDLQNGTGLGGSGTVTFTGGLLRFSSNSVADLSGRIANSTGAIRIDTGDNTVTFASALASNNTGGLTKTGNGTLVLSASNGFTGAVAVQAGVLSLSSSTGFAAGSVSGVTVATNATLLIAQGGQVDDNATVTLSGGTIQRASGVSEVFGSLNLSASSFLDFSGGTAGTITFSGINYTPSALLALDIANFNQGSVLVFQTTNNLSMTGFTFSGTGGFGSSSFDGSTFTITAIPEPPTYLAVAGLLALFAAPAKRLVLRWSCKRFSS
jgi:fibronectin-binding autotransporter adhesin